ncbi:MAG: peptidase dimerization domain-containing protein [Verrucomicrobiae bacterium]|nr:peptidase dimerization domain-containing protein [Verrucomicrobiae bacterium]
MEISQETHLDPVLASLPEWRESLKDLREMVLANTVMCGEIPSPTFEEENLVRFLCNRFTEAGLSSISTDEIGNAVAILPGSEGERSRNLLIVAHVDKIWETTDDHTVTVGAETLTGRGIADNALGAAVLITLPAILEHLGISLNSNLILLGATRSFGKGDLGGLRFFLENSQHHFDAALCLEGMQLERLSYSCLGMRRGEITIDLKSPAARHPGSAGAIAPLNHLVDKILAIERPERPLTEIRLGSVQAGSAYNVAPRSASLRFEVRSESGEIVAGITEQIEEIVDEISAGHEASADLQIIATREPGDIGFSHPLVKSTRTIMETLAIEPALDPSMSELAALLDRGIPALTTGLTRGENRHTSRETIEIAPLFSGLAQLVGVLVLLDKTLSPSPTTPDE